MYGAIISGILSMLGNQQKAQAAKKQALMNAQAQQASLGTMPQAQPQQQFQAPSALDTAGGMIGKYFDGKDKEPDKDLDDYSKSLDKPGSFMNSPMFQQALKDEEES